MNRSYVFLLLALVILTYLFVDESLANYVQMHSTKLLRTVARLTSLTIAPLLHLLLWPLLFLAAVAFFPSKKKALFRLGLNVFCVNGSVAIMKVFFGRARPGLLLRKGIYGFHFFSLNNDYQSFPSRHTATIMALFIGIAALKGQKPYLWLMLAFTLSLSRLLTNSHFLSDILAGLLIALVTHGAIDWLQSYYRGLYDKPQSHIQN